MSMLTLAALNLSFAVFAVAALAAVVRLGHRLPEREHEPALLRALRPRESRENERRTAA